MDRIAIIHDTEIGDGPEALRWAYARRSYALQKYAPEDLKIFRYDNVEWRKHWHLADKFKLIFGLDYLASTAYKKRLKQQGMSVPVVASFNKDANSRATEWVKTCKTSDVVICNNRHRWDRRDPYTNCVCISNGVDTDEWFVETPLIDRPEKVIWCGSSTPGKFKNYREILEPLANAAKREGFDCDFRVVNDITPEQVYPTDRQRRWYNSAAYYINASTSEGTPSSALEAMACGCVYISSPVGNVLEFGVHKKNCYIVDNPRVRGFLDGLRYAREHRIQMAIQSVATMQSWSYGPPGNRSQYFYELFRSVIKHGASSITPFCYEDISHKDVHKCVLPLSTT